MDFPASYFSIQEGQETLFFNSCPTNLAIRHSLPKLSRTEMSQSWKSLKQNMSIFRWNISFLTIRTYVFFWHSLCVNLNSAHSPPKLDSYKLSAIRHWGPFTRDPPARKRPRLPSKNIWHQQIAFGNQWLESMKFQNWGIFSCENKGVWLLVSGRGQGGTLLFINGVIAPINGRK